MDIDFVNFSNQDYWGNGDAKWSQEHLRKDMVGKPVIRGTRLTVEYILNKLAHGESIPEILEEYDGLSNVDIQACLLFVTKSLENTSFMPLEEEIV
ncbi:DUF433 domain-containing protein [candidate division KSB1 bacterium]|nr:DUF433 domain-containing protein [candidate division KSB1 bacterium]